MKLESIKEQIKWVDHWTSNLISDIKEEDYGIIEDLNTSINWQIGHLIISKYFHSIQSVLVEDSSIITKINQDIPIAELFRFYFAGSDPKQIWKNRPGKKLLFNYMSIIDLATTDVQKVLTESMLREPTEIKNPIAKTKVEALTFTFKHQMWHNGQIALIKRVIKEKS